MQSSMQAHDPPQPLIHSHARLDLGSLHKCHTSSYRQHAKKHASDHTLLVNNKIQQPTPESSLLYSLTSFWCVFGLMCVLRLTDATVRGGGGLPASSGGSEVRSALEPSTHTSTFRQVRAWSHGVMGAWACVDGDELACIEYLTSHAWVTYGPCLCTPTLVHEHMHEGVHAATRRKAMLLQAQQRVHLHACRCTSGLLTG